MTTPTLDSDQLEQDNDCCCDFVEIIIDAGERFEIHHVIPDDGAPHAATLECACEPDVERVEYELIVADHKDQDLDVALDDPEEGAWSSSDASTGAGSAPSAPGSC